MKLQQLLVAVLLLLATGIGAQSALQELRLLDLETALPISNLSYTYGSQQGSSDANGSIFITYEAGTTMRLSHLNYGQWTLDATAIEKALKEKVLYRKSVTMNLYPVTVISVKASNKQPDAQLKMNPSDRMEHDAAQILNQLPAFNSIRKAGNYGFDPVFRGFKYDQLNVVLNGAQSATAACPNRMDPPTSQMAPNMMERIEILKGPYALRYGTGFGATINFIPSPLRFGSEADIYGRVSTGFETNGDLLRTEGQLGHSGERHDMNLFASWSQGNDYTDGNGNLVPADFNRGSFGIDLGFKIASNQQLRVSSIYNRARDADFPALAMDLRDDDTWLFNARHDIQIHKENLQSWNTTVFGSFVDHLMNNSLKDLNPRMLNAETAAKTYNYGGRTEGVWNFTNATLFAGADLRVEGAEGTRVREFLMGPMAGTVVEDNAWQDGQISKTGIFAEYQLKGKAFDYIFSGRLELNSSKIQDADADFAALYDDTSVTQVNPSLSVGILKDFSNSVSMGLWLGRAQRSGSLTERYINFFAVGQDPFELLGNPELQAEVNHQVDVTFLWTPTQNTKISVDVFASYITDYISSVIEPDLDPVIPSSPGVRQYVNIEDAFKTGFELSWNQTLFAGLEQQVAVAYTYGQDLERDEPLPEIAPLDLRYQLSGSYFNNKLQPRLVLRHVAEQSRNSIEFGESETPSFTLLDVTLAYHLTNQFTLSMGVNNLFDSAYFEHLNRSVRGTMDPILAPGRNVFANLNFNF